MVEEHRIERHAWELLLEAAANGHETEAEEFRAQYPGPTLRARLMANRRPDPEGEVFPWPVSTSSSEVA